MIKDNIPHIKFKEFLISVDHPERESTEYVAFWLKHIEYCRSGVFVGGVFISGWLYWHMNFFKAPLDIQNEYGDWERVILNLPLRDNEWYIDWAINGAKIESKPLLIFGSRRIAKSVILTSRAAYTVYIKKNSHTLIIGADSGDLGNITAYFEDFYKRRPDCFSDLRTYGTWKDLAINFNKKEVTKTDPITKKKGRVNPITSHLIEITGENTTQYSSISVQNLEHGKKLSKQELLAGKTPSEVILDEVGKYKYNEQYAALKPALMTTDGVYRTVPIFSGTGGSVELSKDAESDFLYTEKSGFFHADIDKYKLVVKPLHFQYTQESDLKTGLFPVAEMCNAGGKKISTPLSEYLNQEFNEEQLEALDGFNIMVTDWKNARERVIKEIAIDEAKSDKDGKKAKMYYPFQPETCFLNTKSSVFPASAARRAQKAIISTGDLGEFVDLHQDKSGKIVITPSKKVPVDTFPFPGGSFDAPVVLYERPSQDPENIMYGSHVGGFDGYKIATSKTTDSVGSAYVFKRKVGVTGYENQIVASIASRPTQEHIFYKQVFLMMKLYNAELLPESDVPFYKYMESIGQTHILANCKNLAQGIVKGTSAANLTYGLPATAPNKEFYLKKVQAYCWEPIVVGYEDDEDSTPITVEGVHRIPDPMLLEEIAQYGDTGNYDRIASFGHALCWDFEMSSNNIEGGIIKERKSFNHNSFLEKIHNQDRRR